MGAWSLVILFSFGCASKQVTHASDALDPKAEQLSHGYGLLYELVSKQAGLGRATIIGSMGKESEGLIALIAAASKDATQEIEAFGKADPAIAIDRTGLPTVEAASREMIESATTGRLLFSGDKFEFRLLATQMDATEYGSMLARAVADLEENAERKKWLKEFALRYGEFRNQVEERLRGGKG